MRLLLLYRVSVVYCSAFRSFVYLAGCYDVMRAFFNYFLRWRFRLGWFEMIEVCTIWNKATGLSRILVFTEQSDRASLFCIFMKQSDITSPSYVFTKQCDIASPSCGFTKQSDIASPSCGFTKQSDIASPSCVFMKQSDRASPSCVFMKQSDIGQDDRTASVTGQTVRDFPWCQWPV